MLRLLLTSGLLACALHAQVHEITAPRIGAHVRFLASDLLEGRGVGTRGEALTTEYLATQLELAGVEPGGAEGTFFQRVPLVGVTTRPEARLTIHGKGQPVALRWLDDFVGHTQRQRTDEAFDADLVFAGHGIVAPEYQWNDYKDVDVRGKVVVLFTGEPASRDTTLFNGPALTYYGRWTYKYEQALRQGALGAVIIHTTPTAGYGWDVVRNSWGKEDPQVRVDAGAPALALAGWVTDAAADRLLVGSGQTTAKLLGEAGSPSFRPIPLGLRLRAHLPAILRAVDTRNVVGVLRGSDDARRKEALVYSAHWDHLGVGTPVNGDRIYNGAIDNATGCAVVLELARAWAGLQRRPARSVVFLFVTAEESGLKGSDFYARHSLFPPGNTVLNLNYDALYPFGRPQDVILSGAEQTTVWPTVQEVAARFNLQIRPDPRPEQGSFYRSDHFSFARAGVPAFSVRMGNAFVGRQEGYGTEQFRSYNSTQYHQPSDEYDPQWDFAGLDQLARFGFALGLTVAEAQAQPRWESGSEFARNKAQPE